MLLSRRFIKSLLFAWRGLSFTWRHELNFRIEVAVAIAVIGFGIAAQIERSAWIALFIVISLVLVLELLNSAMEIIIDLIKPRLHEYVQITKDIMAGAVLLASLISVIVGLFIFLPFFF